MLMRTMFRIALLISLVGVAQPITAWSRLAPFDGIGGNGGAPFRADCGEYGVLVGIIGHSGVVVDQLGGLCVKIDPVSGVWVGGVYETPRHGGSSGSQFRKICPVGNALSGIDGTINNFDGTPVVGSIEIHCIELGIQKIRNGAVILGTRILNRDPDPYKIDALQDYCEPPSPGTGHNQRIWERITVSLEGRAGNFVDHIHVVCGSLALDTRGYRVDFRKSAQSAVPEGTPLQISWRASGARPELTPNLQYSWELYDLTHTSCSSLGCGIQQPTPVRNACTYATQPCGSSWLDYSSGSSVIFNALPPAAYQLKLSVSPAKSPALTQVGAESQAALNFEVLSNMLAALTLNPNTIRPGGTSTATIALMGPATPRGVVIYLSSSNPQLLSTPSSVVLPAGRPNVTLALRSDSRVFSGQVTITASLRRPIGMVALKQSSAQISGLAAQVAPEAGNASSAVAERTPQAARPRVVTRGIGGGVAAPAVSQSSRVAAEVMKAPSDTKEAVLTIQPDLTTKSLTVPKRNLQLGR